MRGSIARRPHLEKFNGDAAPGALPRRFRSRQACADDADLHQETPPRGRKTSLIVTLQILDIEERAGKKVASSIIERHSRRRDGKDQSA
jgi:hypothetical protein